MVPAVGRRPEARPRRALVRRPAVARRRRPRHGDVAAQRPLPGRRRGAGRAAWPPRAWPGGGATVGAGSTRCGRGCSSAGPRPATSRSCSSRTSRTATAGCATCRRCGGRRDADLLVPADDLAAARRLLRHARRRPRGAAPRRPAGPATCCASRTRTPWPTAVGAGSADELMADVAAAARTHRLDRRGRVAPSAAATRSATRSASATGVVVVDREVELAARSRPQRRPGARAAGGARRRRARHAAVARHASTGWPPRSTPATWAERWPAGALAELVAPAPPGPPGHRRARGARPARHPRAPAARSGQPVRSPPAAQRLPPLHRRPAPVGDGGQRRRPHRPRRPPRPAACSAPCSTTSARATRATTPWPAWRCVRRDRAAPRPRRRRRRRRSWRWSSTTCCCPTSRSVAT